ncbi:MAG: acyl-CoA desaturase [Pseudohongiellaceae bacterium]
MSTATSTAKPPVNWTNTLLFSITGLLAVTLVPWYGFTYGYSLWDWTLFVLLMGYCGLSITAGYHRLWSHKAYKAHPVLRVLFALGGACALQNDVLSWASDHRRHHAFVDNNDRDPYSAGRGLWYSHIGWMLRYYESGRNDYSNIKDLRRDPILQWQSRHYLTLVLVMNIAVPALLGYLGGSLIGGLLLGGLLRLVLSQHVTWLINSLAHAWGLQTYSTRSSARDNPVIALLTYGEGYHNFHHTFQWDYRNGVRWWHYDPTKWLIRTCSWLGLTRELKRVSPLVIETTRLEMQYRQAAERCANFANADKWRERLEQEYEQLKQTLQLWARHRQEWYEARAGELHEQWEHLHLRDRYREARYRLKLQRQRWRELLESFSNTPAVVAGT